MQSRTFSIWEGNTPFNSGQAWTDANLVRGLQRLGDKKYAEAIADFQSALTPPENLRAEQRFDSRKAEIAYWTGCAYEGLGDREKAKKAWNESFAATAPANATGGGGRRMGNSPLQQGAQRYFQTLSKQKLGNNEGNETVFNELISSATTALGQPAEVGANAQLASRPQAPRTNAATAHYVAGLGYVGLGNKAKAREEFNAALVATPNFLNAKIALDQL